MYVSYSLKLKCGCNSPVECHFSKVDVRGPTPLTRSRWDIPIIKMNKRHINIIYVLIVIVLVVSMVYFFIEKKSQPLNNQIGTQLGNSTSTIQSPQQVTILSPQPSIIPNKVTIKGLVMQKSINNGVGYFILSTGKDSYTVNLGTDAHIINLRNRQAPASYIQVANTLTVTGALNGSTIDAQIIQIPTIKDEGA